MSFQEFYCFSADDSHFLPQKRLASINPYECLTQRRSTIHCLTLSSDGERCGEAFKICGSQSRECFEELMMEERTLQEISKHPHIVEVFGSELVEEEGLEYLLGDKSPFFLYRMELAMCDLSQFYESTLRRFVQGEGRNQEASEKIVRGIFLQILSAVQHIHLSGFAHLDLKAENILVRPDYTFAVSDFGAARKTCKNICQFNGTLAMAPPEVFYFQEDVGFDGRKADIFALGKILLSLLTGSLCFASATLDDPLYKIMLQRRVGASEFWSHIPKSAHFCAELKELIASMIDPHPNNRPSLAQVENSAWLRREAPSVEETCLVLGDLARNQMEIEIQIY